MMLFLTSTFFCPHPQLMTHTLPFTLVWMLKRLLHPPSLPHANGRVAVNKTAMPRTHANANVGRLSSSPRRATRRRAYDLQGRLPTRQGTMGERRGER